MRVSWGRRALVVGSCVWLLGAGGAPPVSPEPGLLFYLSGDRGLTADVAAGGDPHPNFAADVTVVADGAKGPALQCGHTQLLSYWAPGNIYAERGTLAFYWRSREPVGPTQFPIFRVGYADHSSWDMVWLRIDYNGRGFDAFVTDASLARTRVSVTLPSFPAPDRWTHLALSWDETRGIRFYVDGKLAATQEGRAVFAAALDQFGPHSRVISPYQVQSAYNFVRGGDVDELRIYDRMLADENIATLAKGDVAGPVPPLTRALDQDTWRQAWWLRHGWNRPDDPPPALGATAVAIRKVEIHDVYDLKRWGWKGADGIRETTWPSVYNRSRLPGRNDYFQLPDWDCYSLSGKTVSFTLPDEPWNHVEIAGAAFGSARLVAPGGATSGTPLFDRPKGQERTSHRLPAPVRGQILEFTNVEQETPIGELGAYYVAAGREPDGIGKLSYRLSGAAQPDHPSVKPALDFITGRFASDERGLLVALPSTGPAAFAGGRSAPPSPPAASPALPVVHILIPSDFREAQAGTRRAVATYSWANLPGGLDGIAIDLPALKVSPTHGAYYPLNIQIKDPIWPLRTMLDISVSVKPGEPHTLWLDTRDRILPNDRGLYLSIAGAGPGFGPASLDGASVRLVFKARKDAIAEHVQDRFTQVRDNYAFIVEEQPKTRRLNLFTRFEADITDLLRVDPEHERGRQYWYDYNREQPAPPVAVAEPPAGVPAWAFYQVELLRSIRRFVEYYIDHRQIENGEFGGGLSDDGDLTNAWPGPALMGSIPDKIRSSLLRHMEAFYEQGMFTNGLSTIQTDELHSYEEGIQVLGQSMLMDYGSPRQIERAMETSIGLEGITGINAAGHRHIRSAYFSGTKVATEGVWGWSKPSSYLALHPAIALVDFNGAPRVRKWLVELADSLLAHAKPDDFGVPAVRATVEFATDRDLPGQSDRAWPLMWAAYRWTGDRKYVDPFIKAGPRSLPQLAANVLDILGLREQWAPQIRTAAGLASATDAMRHLAWQVDGDTARLASLYRDQVTAAALREYINTEGSLWVDRVSVPMVEIQRARLGGVALVRNAYVPGHAVGWRFASAGDEERVAVLLRDPTPRRIRVEAYNLGRAAVTAAMSVWDVEPGSWTVTIATRTATGGEAVAAGPPQVLDLERGASLPVTFAPGVATVIELSLVNAGTPYWSRPDLGISREDISVRGREMTVTVHSVGGAAAPAAALVVRDAAGRELGRGRVPALQAPLDLKPRTARVRVSLPAAANLAGATVSVELSGGVREITPLNNRVVLQAGGRSS